MLFEASSSLFRCSSDQVRTASRSYSAQSATLAASFNATNVPGTFTNVRYNGSATVPTNAGTYAVTADFTPTDTATYATLTGAAAGNFVINKATPTLTITNSPVTYNGSQRTATVSGSTGGTVSNIKYNTSATAPTSAGSYAVTANFTPSDTTNFNSLIDATAGTFVINKATPTLSIGNSAVVYNGAAQAAAVNLSMKAVSVTATRGDTRYGICSTEFLDEAFRTTSYRCAITFNDDGSWTYNIQTMLVVRGKPFDHRYEFVEKS